MSEEKVAYNVRPSSTEKSVCQECGMIVQPTEFHPFEFCILWKNGSDPRELYKKIENIALLSSEQAWRKEALRQYPTPDAYEAVCKALDKHCKRADKAQEQLNQAMRVLTSIQQNPHMVPSALCRLIEPTLSQGTEVNHESNNNNSALGDTYSDR